MAILDSIDMQRVIIYPLEPKMLIVPSGKDEQNFFTKVLPEKL